VQQVQPDNNIKSPVVVPTEEKIVSPVSKVLAEIIKVDTSPQIDEKPNQGNVKGTGISTLKHEVLSTTPSL